MTRTGAVTALVWTFVFLACAVRWENASPAFVVAAALVGVGLLMLAASWWEP